MTSGKTLNGIDLKTFGSLQDRFFEDAQPATNDLEQDVQEYTDTLKEALIQRFHGDDNALDTFKLAMRQRSALVNDPQVKQDPDTHTYVKGTMAIAENGSPADSLELTAKLHADGLDPTYKGEAIVAESAPAQAEPIL